MLDERYRLDEELGAGGGGAVYRARHLGLDKDVAVKLLLDEHAGDPALKRRFEREARATAALSHPHIVGMSDFGIADGRPYLVMELLQGTDLYEYLAQHKPLPVATALAIAEQTLEALAYAHEQGLVHRDLKPQNIYMQAVSGREIHVRVLDFGLAKFVDADRKTIGPALTQSGMVLGTPAYMSPEQIGASARVDARADVYSLGILLYEMLAGERPFGGSPMDIARQHLMQPLPKVTAARPKLEHGAALEAVLARATAKEPAARFANASEMLEALRALYPDARMSGGSVMTRRASLGGALEMPKNAPPRAGGASGLRVAVPAAALALGGLLFWMFAGPKTEESGGDRPKAVAQQAAPTPAPTAATAASADEAPTAETQARTDTTAAERALADPWAQGIPAALEPIVSRLDRGRDISSRMEAKLRSHHRSESDARALLLLGRAYVARGWRPDGLEKYLEAYEADPAMRGDPHMLEDLIGLAAHSATGRTARTALQEIYGPSALPALRERLKSADLARSDRATYERLLQTLQAAQKSVR
ncbi:MAG: serine/threonine protein kinase [Myxococcales bacterium]|nr:serine/threonine protein kinase [Myxococcales bacterium]